MSGVLVDSDILIEVLRGRKAEPVRQWTELVNTGVPLDCSPVSLVEIRHYMRERERESIERMLASLNCIPIGVEIAARAGDYLRAFHASHAVELGEAFIAATAALHQLPLWTQNREHFPMKELRFFTGLQSLPR